MFKKGDPKLPNSGRKKGSKNKPKKTMLIHDVLAEHGLDPIKKILELMPLVKEDAQLRGWFEILTYCYAKPKAIEVSEEQMMSPDEEITTDDILSITKAG